MAPTSVENSKQKASREVRTDPRDSEDRIAKYENSGGNHSAIDQW